MYYNECLLYLCISTTTTQSKFVIAYTSSLKIIQFPNLVTEEYYGKSRRIHGWNRTIMGYCFESGRTNKCTINT